MRAAGSEWRRRRQGCRKTRAGAAPMAAAAAAGSMRGEGCPGAQQTAVPSRWARAERVGATKARSVGRVHSRCRACGGLSAPRWWPPASQAGSAAGVGGCGTRAPCAATTCIVCIAIEVGTPAAHAGVQRCCCCAATVGSLPPLLSPSALPVAVGCCPTLRTRLSAPYTRLPTPLMVTNRLPCMQAIAQCSMPATRDSWWPRPPQCPNACTPCLPELEQRAVAGCVRLAARAANVGAGWRRRRGAAGGGGLVAAAARNGCLYSSPSQRLDVTHNAVTQGCPWPDEP